MQRRMLICGPLRVALGLLAATACWLDLPGNATCRGADPAPAAQGPPAAAPPAGIRLAQFPRRRVRPQPAPDAFTEESALDSVFLPPDRNLKKRLEEAGELLAKGQNGEAVRRLGSLLEGSEDYFFRPDPTQHVYRSLKAEAGRLIGEMPPEGRESYELQFGARARRMLTEAAAAGDIAGIAEVTRRFFYTQAGFEATLLLARHHLDHDRPLAAALGLERLRETPRAGASLEPMLSLTLAVCWVRSGMPERARQVLAEFKKQYPHEEVRIGERTVRLFSSPQDALAWLDENAGKQHPQQHLAADQWTLFRGDPQRNASSAGGAPLLNRRWSRLCADEPAIDKIVGPLRQAYLDQDVAALPSMQPLAVGDVVLMRTATNLLAVNFETGKLVWTARSIADRSLEQLGGSGRGPSQFGGPSPLQSGLDQRMWDDAIFGNITSDGQQVFLVEDLPLSGGATNQFPGQVGFARPAVFMPNGRRVAAGLPRSTNRLTARELKTEGKLKWEVGGNSGEDEPKLAGAFFLGPPLPLLGRLYALAEMKGQEIRLVALSAKTGHLDWSQQLAMVEQGVLQDGYRRSAGAMPSFADGVLVCPTSAGALVAIDLTNRSLLWGYQYPRDQRGQPGMGRFALQGNFVIGGADRHGNDHWVDATVTIAEGSVLATPVEDDTLYCLQLLDGKLRWKLPRENNLYVGCVYQGNALLVGHNQLTAVKLSDGKPAWGPVELPAGAMPSGRGFMSGKFYYLPLSTAEVAQVDLADGKIVGRARSRQGTIPGNLICYRGDVISQGVDVVEAYPQIDALRKQVDETLARQPDDPTALAQLGEIKLDEGHLAEAIRLLRRSYELKPDDMTRELLVESLLEGMQADFAANRGAAQELEKLLETRQQQTTYLRLVAAGLQKLGERLPAFDAYLKLASPEHASATPDPLSDTHSVRRDRWIQAQLTALRADASDKERQAMDGIVAARLEEAAQQNGAEALEQLLALFGSHPSADEIREQIVQRLSGPDTMLEREQLLLQLLRSPEPARVRAAKARLAILLREARRPELAAIYYRQLAGELADEVCLDGKTGSELIAELPPGSDIQLLLAPPRPWPSGQVETVKPAAGKTLSGSHHQRSFDLELRGATGPFFEGVNVAIDSQQQSVLAEDALGRERFRVSLSDGGAQRRGLQFNGPFNNLPLSYAEVHGNLLLVWLGHHVVAVDTLRAKESIGSRFLWSHDLQQQFPGMPNLSVHHRPVNVPWGPPRYVAAYPYGKPIGTLGPPTSQGVCFQRFRDLVCVDPVSGEVMWTRKNMPLGCEIFGDEEVAIAAPPEGGEATVLRMLDGEVLGKRPVPPMENRMATVGRYLLTWQAEDGKQVVKYSDPWKQQVFWSRPVTFGAKGAVAGQEAVGIFETSGKVGKFSLVRLADGKVLVDKEKVEPENSLLGIYLLSMPDGYLLLTNGAPSNVPQNESIQPAPGGMNNPLVNGRLYGFDRDGKRLWGAVKIDQQGLVLNQPSALPILTFARHVHHSAGNGQPDAKTSLLCVDKRSGRVVYQNDSVLNTAISNFEQVGDRSDDTVSILLPGKTVTLKCTDKEVPPEAAAEQAGAKRGRGSAVESAAEALGRILEGALKPLKPHKPGENDDD